MVAFSPFNLMVLVVVTIAMLLLTLLFQKTNIGLALRASAFPPEIARLSGIKVDAVRTLGWAIAGAVGGLAGMLYVPGSYLHPNAMDVLLVFGFIAAVIGGLESLPGAVIGGLVLGLGVSIVLNYVGTSLVFPSIFVVLIISLIVRPNGILGAKKVRSA